MGPLWKERTVERKQLKVAQLLLFEEKGHMEDVLTLQLPPRHGKGPEVPKVLRIPMLYPAQEVLADQAPFCRANFTTLLIFVVPKDMILYFLYLYITFAGL